MSGITPAEGRAAWGEVMFNGAAITGFSIALLTNAIGSLGDASVLANITEPIGGGYARIAVPRSGWTVTSNSITRSPVTFTANAFGFTGNITGAALIANVAGVDKLMGVSFDTQAVPIGPFQPYIVDLNTITG